MEEETKEVEAEDEKEEEGSKEEQEIVKQAKEVAETQVNVEELKKANLEKEEKLLERKEALNALGGQSPAGTKPEAPKEMTDTEYAEALQRGEVNPLKQDGII